MSPDRPMKILGPKSDEILRDVGITSVDDVRTVGVEEVFRRVKLVHPKVTLNFLWGLEAAATNTDWRELTDERKRELKRNLSDVVPNPDGRFPLG